MLEIKASLHVLITDSLYSCSCCCFLGWLTWSWWHHHNCKTWKCSVCNLEKSHENMRFLCLPHNLQSWSVCLCSALLHIDILMSCIQLADDNLHSEWVSPARYSISACRFPTAPLWRGCLCKCIASVTSFKRHEVLNIWHVVADLKSLSLFSLEQSYSLVTMEPWAYQKIVIA